MITQGFIKLHRKIMDSPLWQSCKPERKVILITILLKANHKEKTIILDSTREKITLLPGQFVTSRSKLAKECGKGISEQMIRSALNYFEKHDFLTKQSTSKSTNGYTLITIKNWGLYQVDDRNQPSKQPRNQSSTNQAPTTNKNVKNDKNKYIYSRVITQLNQLTGKNYKPTTKKTIDCIDARLNEDFTEKDFYKVIEIKTKEWLGTEYEKYLRPETLFGNKFEGYLNQSKAHDPAEEKTKSEIIDGYKYETV